MDVTGANPVVSSEITTLHEKCSSEWQRYYKSTPDALRVINDAVDKVIKHLTVDNKNPKDLHRSFVIADILWSYGQIRDVYLIALGIFSLCPDLDSPFTADIKSANTFLRPTTGVSFTRFTSYSEQTQNLILARMLERAKTITRFDAMEAEYKRFKTINQQDYGLGCANQQLFFIVQRTINSKYEEFIK